MKNEYSVNGEVTSIYVRYKSITLKTIIDTEDLPRLLEMNCTWCAMKNGHGGFYVVTGYEGNNIRLHRFILSCPSDMVVDHIFHDTLDNRKSQLRIVTAAQNRQNTKELSKNPCRVRGVFWNRITELWDVVFKVDGRYIRQGFDDIQDAIEANRELRAKFLPYSLEAALRGKQDDL